ncbi:MAG TPA: universal stress protein [Longimicrobiales bacterium]|nr:universal stress protein [Longimicrobiales bacterium]
MAERHSILLSVRVGEDSLATGRTAAWLADALEADITMVNVAIELEGARQVAAAGGLEEADVRARMIDEARAMAEAWGRQALSGRPFQLIMEEGDVAERVAATAEAIGAELIVAGSQARGALKGIILGDTTREILRRAHCPVVVVPPGAEVGGAGPE